MKTNLTTVLFDLDGTLLDTAPDLATALNTVLTNHQRPKLPFETIRPYSSMGTRGLLKLGFQIDEAHAEYKELREQFLQAYHHHIFDETSIFPGIEQVIAQVENQGLRWGVVTNKPFGLAQQLMQHFKLIDRCACLVGGDTLAKHKPDPEQLLYACEMIGCSTDESVYIGDAARDIEAARRANMRSVAALYGYITPEERPETWQADYYVDRPQDIIDWLMKNLSK